ncbi:MAG: TetR/AcrR family transcriptional regulator [Planctomycetota bacterium]
MPPASSTATPRRPDRIDRARWDAADHDARRDLIIDAALELLYERGHDAVTVRRVAQRVGVGAMTLYTYFDGQDQLRRAMVRRGFEMLGSGCQDAGETLLDQTGSWMGGAMNYLRFAMERPRLYELMFNTQLPPEDADLIEAGFQPLLAKVRQQLTLMGWPEAQTPKEARRRAGRYWLALHGLAMIAASGRLSVLEGGLEQVLGDLLEHVAPTRPGESRPPRHG